VRFSNPCWLPAGLLACLALIWMWHIYDARRHTALAKFVSAHLRRQLTRSISVAGRRAQRALYLAAVACLFTALAGPLVGYRWEQISRRGNDIVFAIDTSRSMSTPDVKPDRLTRAKLAIDDFAGHLDGDAVGIVAFAGRAFLVCPITLDYGAFHETLGAIDTNTIPRGGTDISRAIQEAQAALRLRPGSDKILILVTDGEDLEGSALAAARSAAQQDGLKIYTLGVGTAAGDLIPIPPAQGGGFVKDETGAFVKSRLDEAALKAIAAATGGIYAPLGAQGEGVEAIFKTVFGSIATHDLAVRLRKIYIERYQWPLAASLGMLLGSLLIGTRRRVGARQPAARGVAAASSLALLMTLPFPTARSASVSAEDAYKKGDFTAAEQAYAAAAQRNPKEPVLQFNTGAAAYRAGQFAQAAQAFEQSISRAPSSDPKRLAVQEDAYYNLGNALYRTGQKTEQTDPQETLHKWGQAVKAYETALQLRADDADSKYNRDLVKRKIDALQQKQDQRRNPQQKQGPDQQQNKGQGQQQSPPPNGGGSKGDQPPGNARQPPPPPATGEPARTKPPGAGSQSPADDAQTADSRPPPGQMSREEARELLDSAKGDERHPLGVPLASRSDDEPEKPYKNW
jgi:Ca-activated chloride channel family protein